MLILIGINLLLEMGNDSTITQLGQNGFDINKLVFSELLTDNEGIYIDNNGNIYDWIELYNGSNKDINLKGYGLSDSDDGEVKWIFPDVTINSKSYLILNLSGDNKDSLYVNFSLKNTGGEIVTLKSSNGKVIDTVKTVSLNKNNSMYRNDEGNWEVTDEITPGFENTSKGYNEYLNSISRGYNTSEIEFSEVLYYNNGNFNNKGKLYGYVEIINKSKDNINLNDYYLSDDSKVLYKYRLKDYILNSGSSYVLFDNDKELNFKIDNNNKSLFISNKNGIVDKINYDNLSKGVAYLKINNAWYESNDISPGYSNDSSGKNEFQKKYDIPNKSLIINEIMSSNSSYLSQNGNKYYDWIELYNNSDDIIYLNQYHMSTNMNDKNMYQLPDIELKPNEYIVLMASGDPLLSNNNYYHTNFKLSSGKGLFLFKNNKIVDSMFVYEVPLNYSYGRGNEYGHFYYSKPTPGTINDSDGITSVSLRPIFDNGGGIYNDINELTINLSGIGDIYYTLDGSTPNKNSTKYVNPIIINKTTVIKAISYENNKSSEVVTNSYIINENHSLPVISLSLNNSDFNYLNSSLYSNIVVNSYVEFYEKNSGFSMTCGLKLFGGASRLLDKKSFSLKFGNKYSVNSLNYKVFDNKNIYEFGDLVLRSGSQDQNLSMFRDEFISKMLLDYGTLTVQSYKPVVLYINGNYWGIYFIREKIDENFVESNHNVSGPTNIVNHIFVTEEGSNNDFVELKKYILENDMSLDSSYEYVSSKLDIDNFIDYYVLEFIISNSDPHNYRLYNNSNLDGGKIKVIVYDSDYAFYSNYESSYFNFLINKYNLKQPPDTTYLEGLLKNPKFKKRFVERISYYLKNIWTEEHINNSINYFYELIKPEMNRNSSRWNKSYSNWEKEVEKLRKNALSKINDIPKYTKTYFKLNEEEYNEYFK